MLNYGGLDLTWGGAGPAQRLAAFPPHETEEEKENRQDSPKPVIFPQQRL